jgi:EAL domain-containing protein (putative c-di-GMP-specific phosphodiesterase class I)
VSRNAAFAALTSKRVHERFMKDLDSNRFVLFFQAIAPLAAKERADYGEILIRFKEEERNLQSPGMFLSLLEEQGLMPQLDRWIVSRVLKWTREVDAKLGPGSAPLCSVNLAGDTLRDESAFGGHVLDEIRQAGGRADALSFEILECDAMANRQSITRLMLPLRSAGCGFALSGHAGDNKAFELAVSLGFAFIKIDASMLRGLASAPQAREDLAAVNRRCHEYGMRTIGMQVEDHETLEILRGIGVDFAQGFGIERPRPLEFPGGAGS